MLWTLQVWNTVLDCTLDNHENVLQNYNTVFNLDLDLDLPVEKKK